MSQRSGNNSRRATTCKASAACDLTGNHIHAYNSNSGTIFSGLVRLARSISGSLSERDQNGAVRVVEIDPKNARIAAQLNAMEKHFRKRKLQGVNVDTELARIDGTRRMLGLPL